MDAFQVAAAAIARSLINNPNYAYLFTEFPDDAKEMIRRGELLDQRIREDDPPAVLPLKQELKKRIYQAAYDRYVQKMKKEHEESERLAAAKKRAEEAEKELLAEEMQGKKKTAAKKK